MGPGIGAAQKVGGEERGCVRYCRCSREETPKNGEEQTDERGTKNWRGDGQGRPHGTRYGEESGEGKRGGEERAGTRRQAGGGAEEATGEVHEEAEEGAGLTPRGSAPARRDWCLNPQAAI